MTPKHCKKTSQFRLNIKCLLPEKAMIWLSPSASCRRSWNGPVAPGISVPKLFAPSLRVPSLLICIVWCILARRVVHWWTMSISPLAWICPMCNSRWLCHWSGSEHDLPWFSDPIRATLKRECVRRCQKQSETNRKRELLENSIIVLTDSEI